MDGSLDLTNVSLQTERLLLRPLRDDDLQDFNAYAKVPGVGEMAGWKHHESIEESWQILQSIIECGEVLAIVHRADQKVIGTLGIHPIGKEKAEAYPGYRMREIGYVLSKDYWGQGLMPEAVQAAVSFCFDTLKLDALVCCHFKDNQQSRRVIEKCGFRYFSQGQFESTRLNKTFDDLRYILLRKEWADDGTGRAER